MNDCDCPPCGEAPHDIDCHSYRPAVARPDQGDGDGGPTPHVCQFCGTPLRDHWWDACTYTPPAPAVDPAHGAEWEQCPKRHASEGQHLVDCPANPHAAMADLLVERLEALADQWSALCVGVPARGSYDNGLYVGLLQAARELRAALREGLVADLRGRAALVLAEIEQYVDVRKRQRILTAALDAAEARGRAEVAGEVKALATEWLREGTAPTQALRLRRLAAEVEA